MKGALKLIFAVGLALSLYGCLTVTPLEKNISLSDGQSQVFTAVSDIKNAQVVWRLDGVQVAIGSGHTFRGVGSDIEQTYTLEVSEEGGNPLKRHDKVKWTITVAAGGDMDRDGVYPPEDCDDNNAAINPSAQEICGNLVDENCDAIICSDPPNRIPENVEATDLDSGRIDIGITWDAIEGATYYIIQRATWTDEEGRYRVVGRSDVNAFTYAQDFETDLFAKIGPNPILPVKSTDSQRKAFLPVLENYRLEKVEPVLFDFKAPAYFRVQACNASGCGEFSEPDRGQANFIHTEEYSELAPVVIMIFGEPMLRILADVPTGPAGASYCGVDICGYEGYGGPGGLIMGRVDAEIMAQEVNFDTYYEDYVMGSDIFPFTDSIAITDGHLGGFMNLDDGSNGIYTVSGSGFTMRLFGIECGFESFMYFGGNSGNPNDGYVNVTWNGITAQYTMPIQPADVQTNPNYLEAIKPSAIYPHRTDSFGWVPSKADYPAYFSASSQPKATCRHNSGADGVVEMCYMQ